MKVEPEESTSSESEPERDEDVGAAEVLEPWVDWIRRATGLAELHLHKAGAEDWTGEHKRRKWRCAGHLARRDDDRWSKKSLDWTPPGTRKVGRPHARWSDSLDRFATTLFNTEYEKGSWQVLAQDRETWKVLEQDFINM